MELSGVKGLRAGPADFLKKMMMEKPHLFKEKGCSSTSPISNTNFRAVVKDGMERETRYQCNVCEKDFSTVHSVKTHITKVHVNVKKTDNEAEKKDDNVDKGKKRGLAETSPEKEDKRSRVSTKEFDMADVERWARGRKPADEEVNNAEPEVMEYEMLTQPSKDLPAAQVDRWNNDWKEMVAEKESKVIQLEETLLNNKELMNVLSGEKASLETDNKQKDEYIKKLEEQAVLFQDAFMRLNQEVESLENRSTDQKVKDIRKELKDKKKELDDEKKYKEEALKKVKDESNRRHKAETEMAAMRRQIKNMTTMAEEKSKKEELALRSRRERSRERKRSPAKRRLENRKRSPLFSSKTSNNTDEGERRRSRSRHGDKRRSNSKDVGARSSRDGRRRMSKDYEKEKRSRSKEKSRRSRSKERRSRSKDQVGQMKDCVYWMLGICLYGNECKKGVHDPKKEGQNKQQTQRSKSDFPQAMVGAPWGPTMNEPMMMVPASQVYGQQGGQAYGQQGLQGGQLFRQQGQVYSQQGQVYSQGMAGRSFGPR